MSQAPTTGTAPTPATPTTKRAQRRMVLPIEQQHQNETFRDERSPIELESEAIDAEASGRPPSGWTTRG